jgi:hypothetical protein
MTSGETRATIDSRELSGVATVTSPHPDLIAASPHKTAAPE